jgi:hypothetical protein
VALTALLIACGDRDFSGGDDAPPTSGEPVLGFDTMSSSYDETEGELEIYIHLSQPATELVTYWMDIGGSATNGTDYVAYGTGVGVIPPGIDFASITVQLTDDGRPEPAETIELTLSKGTNYALGIARHTLTIRDNVFPRVTFENATSGANENTAGSVDIFVMPASAVPITVDYSISGAASSNDHALQNGSLTIPAGETVVPFTFSHIDDALDEDDETIVVTMSNPTNAILGITPTNTHTIYDDDDEPYAAFVAMNETVTEGDSGTQVLSVEVRLDAASGRTVSVGFGPGDPQFFSATLGVDYTIVTPSPLVFPPGTTSQTISVEIVGDTIHDGSDRAAIKLTSGHIGYPDSHIIQIDNDDCLGAGAWRVCPDSALTSDLVLDSTTSFGTTFNTSPCASRQPLGWIESGQPESCFIVARNISVGTAKFAGFRPVVLVALDSISVNTLLDAGSHIVVDTIGIGGAGSNPPVCATPATSNLNMGAGGAGGSFMTPGGNGGSHGPSDPGGTAASSGSAPSVLRGGCTAQQPANNGTGLGGGAVYLLAGNTITIAPNAVINASGGGGSAGWSWKGGNGGGSGGMIVLWAQSIIASQGHLLANGGGGGEGAEGSTQNAMSGEDVNFSTPFTPAPGGSGSSGGDGGAGAVQGISAVSGVDATSARGAGGGGGGLGYILVHPSLNNAVSSPTPATFKLVVEALRSGAIAASARRHSITGPRSRTNGPSRLTSYHLSFETRGGECSSERLEPPPDAEEQPGVFFDRGLSEALACAMASLECGDHFFLRIGIVHDAHGPLGQLRSPQAGLERTKPPR